MTDPKPPAASGDQYDTLAAKYACESGGCCCNLQGDDFAHFMRQAAKEAQLRVLEELQALAQWPNNPGKQAERRAQMIDQLENGDGPL